MRLLGSTPWLQHCSYRNQVDIRSGSPVIAKIVARVAHIGHFEKARPRHSPRHREAVAVRIRLPVVLAVHRRRAGCLVGDIQGIEILRQNRNAVDVGAETAAHHARGNVQPVGELAGVVVIPAPAAAKNGLAAAGEVVSHAKTRLPEERPSREPAERNIRITLVPFEPAVLERGARRAVLRVVEDRVAVAEPVHPGLEVGSAKAEFQREAAADLPGILNEALVRGVGDVVDAVERRLVIGVECSGDQIGIRVAQGIRIADVHFDEPVGVVVRGLRVADPFPEPAGLDRVGAHYLGDGVADARHVLVGIQARRCAAGLETAGVEHQRRFAAAPSAKGRNLGYAILKQPLVVVADLRAIHFGRILENVGEADEGVAEDEFVRHARAKNVGERGGNRIRAIPAYDRRRIWHLPAVAPPQSHREQLRFPLQVIPDEQLRVVADAVIHARHPLRVVLIERFRLYVIEPAVGVRVGVRLREQLHQSLHVRVDQRRRQDAAGGLLQGCRVQLSRRAAGRRNVAFLGDFGRREVARNFARRRDGGAQQSGVEGLVEVFEPGEEEELVAVLVEIRAGDQNRTADGKPGIVILVLGPLLAARVEQRIIGVHRVVARVEEPRTVEILSARLGHRAHHRRTLLVLGGEVRRHHLELLDHVGVGVHRGVAIAARVGDVSAVRGDVQRIAGQAVV